jgi:hypothetical protein
VHGVWGGTTEEERRGSRSISRRLRIVAGRQTRGEAAAVRGVPLPAGNPVVVARGATTTGSHGAGQRGLAAVVRPPRIGAAFQQRPDHRLVAVVGGEGGGVPGPGQAEDLLGESMRRHQSWTQAGRPCPSSGDISASMRRRLAGRCLLSPDAGTASERGRAGCGVPRPARCGHADR